MVAAECVLPACPRPRGQHSPRGHWGSEGCSLPGLLGHRTARAQARAQAWPWPCLCAAWRWSLEGDGGHTCPWRAGAFSGGRTTRGAGPAAGRPECHPGEPPQAEPCPSHACWTGVCRPHAPAPRSGPSSRGRAEPRGRRERPAGREGAFVVCCPGPTVDSAQRGGRRCPSADVALVTA